MAASGETIYRLAYMMAIGGAPITETVDGQDYCGVGLDIDDVRRIFNARGWNSSYRHRSWQRAIEMWEEFHNVRRIGHTVFFVPKFCDMTTCAVKIQSAMTENAVAVIS